MKKILLSLFCMFTITAMFAQLKVVSDGKVVVGGDGTAPTGTLEVGHNGLSAGFLDFKATNTILRYLAYGPGQSTWMQSGKALTSGSTADLFFSGIFGTPVRMAIKANGYVGIGIANPSALFHVNGTAVKPGGGSWIAVSDRRLKKDINAFSDGLNEVLEINPVTFKYNGKGGMPDDGKEYVGIIAQQMQKVAPYAVDTYKHEVVEQIKTGERSNTQYEHKVVGEEEYLQFDATSLPYMLVNSIKELNSKIEKLEAKIQVLETSKNKVSKTAKNN